MACVPMPSIPKQQKQKAVDERMPSDPAERKRVLNVLAQRRYRRRKKEQQAQLESFIQTLDGNPGIRDNGEREDVSSPSQANSHVADSAALASRSTNSSSTSSARSESTGPSWSSASFDKDLAMSDVDFSSLLNFPSENNNLESMGNTQQIPIDETSLASMDSLSSTPLQDFAFQLSSFLQNDDVQNSSFADDYYVSVPELDLLRACFLIATRLNSVDRVFDPNGTSIFLSSSASFDWSLLPENLRPTQTQLMLPHHPVLDLIPWPKVRTKLITMFSMPPESWPRHPIDQAEMSPFRLVCDMEDGGIRIYGDDPTNEVAWELQQRFVDAWWWALDQSVVTLSNQKRKARGEEQLKIGLLST